MLCCWISWRFRKLRASSSIFIFPSLELSLNSLIINSLLTKLLLLPASDSCYTWNVWFYNLYWLFSSFLWYVSIKVYFFDSSCLSYVSITLTNIVSFDLCPVVTVSSVGKSLVKLDLRGAIIVLPCMACSNIRSHSCSMALTTYNFSFYIINAPLST